MSEAFFEMLDQKEGRIVNLGGGAGPIYVSKASEADQKFLTSSDKEWEQIESYVHKHLSGGRLSSSECYGLSKAALA